MRLFAYELEERRAGFIRAEFAVADFHWEEAAEVGMARELLPGVDSYGRAELLTRDELLAVSVRRRALMAWETGEDSAMEACMVACSRRDDVDAARELADMGCREAGAVLARRPEPEELKGWLKEHQCSPRVCGRRSPHGTRHLEAVPDGATAPPMLVGPDHETESSRWGLGPSGHLDRRWLLYAVANLMRLHGQAERIRRGLGDDLVRWVGEIAGECSVEGDASPE